MNQEQKDHCQLATNAGLYELAGLVQMKYDEFEIERLKEFTFYKNHRYTASATVQVHYRGESAAMQIIVFRPGDGTGETNQANASIATPENYKYTDGRMLPTSKNAAVEAVFPITHLCPGTPNYKYRNNFALEEYTIKDRHLQLLCTHNREKEKICSITKGSLLDGTTFGEPNAIYYNPNSENGKAGIIQVAGLLSLPPRHNLIELITDFGRVPQSLNYRV